jgi:mRNA interferase RelE/StbE
MLAVDPRPPASRPLRGRSAYRVRIGDHRVSYRIEDDVLLVVVVRLAHRSHVYDA